MRIGPHILSQIERCSWQYKLDWIDHLTGMPNNRNFVVGSVCDQLVVSWFKRGCERGWMQKHAEKCFEYYLEKNPVQWMAISKATLSKENVRTDRELLRQRVFEYVPKIEQVFLRYEIAGNKNIQPQRYGLTPFPNYPQHEMAGTADFFDHEKRVVLELKVTKSAEWLDKDQLLFYAALFTALDKARVNRLAFIAPLMQHPIVELPFDYADVRSLLKRCLGAVQLIESGQFKPAGKTRICYGCKFRGPECPAWAVRAVDTSTQHYGMRPVKY